MEFPMQPIWEGVPVIEAEGEAQASEQSVGQTDPKTLGWTRRVRIGAAAPGRTPCPDCTSALEKEIRSFTENPGDTVIVHALGTSFDTLGEAYDLYKLYSWEKGSGIRYGMSKCGEDKVHARNLLWLCDSRVGV
ncbi:hypothetical protein ACQJBY_018678 [Aegilops geniculata]